MSRHNLTDSEWNAIRVFLPAERTGKPGRPWSSHRQIINGILYALYTGVPWRDLPAEFGKYQTVFNRFRRWVREDRWSRIVRRVIGHHRSESEIDFRLWCVDGTIVRAHRAAAGALKRGMTAEESAEINGLGRSRGGFSSKLHVITDGQGKPLSVTVTPGQCNEAPEFKNVVAACEVNTYRKENRPEAIAGDKAYSSDEIRNSTSASGIQPVIPTRSNERPNKRFNKKLYRRRNVIERFIGWLKENRRIATRYDKTIESYRAMIHIAILKMLLNWY